VFVSPLLTAEEEDQIQAMTKGKNGEEASGNGKGGLPHLRALLKEKLILLQLDFKHPLEVIETLATKFYQEGYVEKTYIESAIIRERNSSTSIDGSIAIPHGDPAFIKNSAIAFGS
jgi:activator of the mannose operon (transcriptional antiterminator)